MQQRSGAQKCDRENDLITFLYGECDETEARNFEQHLRTCAVCESDLAAFRQVHESMTAWRYEVLGATKTAPASSVVLNDSAVTRQRSAVAALREFFNLSPLWLKGAVAFGSILFCLFAALTIINMRDENKPSIASNNNRIYTQEELNKRIEEAVAATRQQLTADKERMAQDQNVSHKGSNHRDSHGVAVAAQSRKSPSRPLSKSEREQLAADLRLISSNEELSLDLLGDRINQQE